MDIRNLIIGMLAGLAVLFGGWAFLTHTAVQPPFGAIAGPEIPFDHICVGGVCTYSYKEAIAATSSVPCSFPFPNTGTSTVTSATMVVTANGLSAAQTIDISTSSNAVATASV